MKLIVYILLLFIIKVNALIETNQYNCLIALSNNFAIFSSFVVPDINGQKDFCSTNSVQCSQGSISDITFGDFNSLQADPLKQIGYDDIKCLNKITSLTLSSFNIGESLYTTQHPTLLSLSITYPIGFTSTGITISSFSKLSIDFGTYASPITFPITMFFSVGEVIIKNGDISFIRGSSGISGTLSKIDIQSNTIPALTSIKVKESMILRMGKNFDASTLNILDSWTDVAAVSLYPNVNKGVFDFPIGLLNVGSNLKSIYTEYSFKPLTVGIDLSNLKGLTDVQFINAGPSFYINNLDGTKGFPIVKYPANKFSLVLSGASFDSIPSFSTFTNPGTIQLTGNTVSNLLPIYQPFSSSHLSITGNLLSGTLDSSYCSADLYNMDLSDNSLGGTIPECISCYLGDGVVYDSLDGNDFSNFVVPTTPCTSIKPKFGFLNSTHIQLTGENLGFSATNIQSLPPFSWEMVTPGSKYIALYSNPDNYQNTRINFKVPSLSWTFSLDSTIGPDIQSVVILGGLLTIQGEFFSEDSSVVSVDLDSVPCTIVSSTFSTVKCTPQSLDASKTNSLLTLKVNGLSKSVYISQASGTYASPCQVCLSTRGVCNIATGVCQCLAGYSGPTCGSQVIQCANNCSGHGDCDYSSGKCSCNYPYTSGDVDDCSKITCSSDCGGSEKGQCDMDVGQCDCKEFWTGDDCKKAAIYADTFSSVSEAGGLVQIGGWFGNETAPSDLIVMIGDLKCQIETITYNLVSCNIGSGKGKKFANMTLDGVQWKSNLVVFEYISDSANNLCSPTCKNGKCVNKICDCSGTSFKGIDCSEPIKNNTPSTGTQVNNNGTSIIYNGKTQYQIYLLSIIEINILGDTVKEYPLATTWRVIESNQDEGVTVFSQLINNNSTQLNFTVEEISEKEFPNGKSYSFAGENFIVSPNSIKIQFSMFNYTYSSSLNSLKLLMESSVSQDNQEECNSEASSTETQEEDSTLSYLSISKDNKKMFGRFLDKAIVDDRSTLISTSIYSKNDSSIIVSINLPHSKNVIIDPDFSVLVKPSFVDSCEDSKKNWIIPVAIVVPVVAISLIIVTTIIILKKNRMTIKLKLNSLNRSMSMRSFKSKD